MTTKAEIIAFVARVEAESNVDLKKIFGSGDYDPSKKFEATFGRKYAKIVDVQGQSVWGFVNMENGDLLKAAGWATPAKHARGNISDAAYGKNYVWTGPNYLR